MTLVLAATDPGLQNERTAMAWRRTALSLLVAAATMAKVSGSAWGAASWLWLVAGVPAALIILVASSRTYLARRGDALARRPVLLVALTSGATLVIGLLSLLLVLDR